MLNFEDLYDAYARDIYNFSLWMSGDSQEAEDITSETFIRAWAKKGVIRTYDWREYEVKEITGDKLILIDKNNEELRLDNTYNLRFNAGDTVRYDRLNNLLKKVR